VQTHFRTFFIPKAMGVGHWAWVLRKSLSTAIVVCEFRTGRFQSLTAKHSRARAPPFRFFLPENGKGGQETGQRSCNKLERARPRAARKNGFGLLVVEDQMAGAQVGPWGTSRKSG